MKIKSKLNKYVLILALGLGVLFLQPNSADASYTNTFSWTQGQGWVGSMQSSSLFTKTNSGAGYFRPLTSHAPTSYMLSPQRNSGIRATNLFENVTTAGKRNFTWQSGYGGVGTRYCLSAYPTQHNFGTYSITVEWSPQP